MKCNFCGEDVKENGIGCDWNQGRCPYRRPFVDDILLDNYKARYYNLLNSIRNWFKK